MEDQTMENNNVEQRNRRPRSSARKAGRVCGMVGIGLAFAFLFALVFGFLVKWLWNWIIPDIFGLGTITYWQAFGMLILAKILFGGFGRHGHSRSHPKTGYYHDRFHGRTDQGPADPDDEHSRHCSFDRWKHYGRYWRDKGRDDFNRYANGVEKQAAGTSGATEPESDQ
jgi:hypothetical protein